MKKIAVMYNEKGFMRYYLEHFLELCSRNNVEADIYEYDFKGDFNRKNIKSIKNFNKKIDEITKDKNYDFILSDSLPVQSVCTVFHSSSILQRMNLSPNWLYKLIFFFGHYSRIKYFRNFYKNQKKIFVVSEIMKKDYSKNCNIPEEKIKVLIPGIQFYKEEPEESLPYTSNEEFIIAMSACGFVTKGGFILLDAMRHLKKEYPNIKAKIIYPKHKKNIGVKLYIAFFNLHKNIEFCEFQKDMKAFYKSCHCFVVPSLCEPFGRVATEAMNFRVPVVVGSNVGAKDVIKDGYNGFIFEMDKNQGKNLASKIKEVMNKYNDLGELKERAYKTASKCTWEKFAKEMFDELFAFS